MIPTLIHQIWHPFSSPDMPRDWLRFSRTWKRWHPKHEYRLWGPEESQRFVAEHYPDFLPTYQGYSTPIKRVDSLRILLLHHFGGIYADLDVECLRNVEELLEGQRIVVPAEPVRHSYLWRHKGYRQVLSTAFMASEAGHPFWRSVIGEMERSSHIDDVMDSTGPFVITRCYENDPEREAITLAAPEIIYPVDEPECRDWTAYDLEYWVRATAKAYAVHHWASTWNRPGAQGRPALRPYHHGLPAKLRHPELHKARPGQLFDTGALVSCIMVTRGWKEPARWSIECFRNQTYRNRELVVATTNAEGDLAGYIESLRDPRIRLAGVLPEGTSLGALRNHAVSQAKGEFVATWDDDDLFGADRLAAGMTTIVTSGAAAAFLERICIWWPARQHLIISARHHWENTMIAQKRALPAYQEIDRAEDSTAVAQIVDQHPIMTIDDPNLFVYVVSGSNTWGPDHFQQFFQRATFSARGPDYERALSVLNKHVPLLEYLEWLQNRDPRTFDPPPDSTAQLDASEPAARRLTGARPRRGATTRARGNGAAAVSSQRPLRFALAWELGGGLGHTVPLSQVARPLLEAGHEVHLVLTDLSTAHSALGRLVTHPGLRVWQAPIWPAPLLGFADPACYAELLFRAGYLDHRRLGGLVDGWDSLFRQIQPDLLVADHAPTALLAARGHSFKRALFGTGFFNPLPETPMASFREWEPISQSRLAQSEQLVLDTCNSILAVRRLPPMEHLHQLLDADEEFLITVRELDHFERRARIPEQRYWGGMPPASQGRAADWPRGTAPAVFVYLKAEYAPARDVLKALRDSPWRVLAYVPGLTANQATELSSSRQSIVLDPIDMTEVCRTCDVVLCNSGSGTVSTALHAGKPVVMLPMHIEQFLFARRVQRMGAGIALLEDRVGRLPDTLRRVIEQPTFRDAALAFSRRYASPNGNRVAESIAERCVELAGAGDEPRVVAVEHPLPELRPA